MPKNFRDFGIAKNNFHVCQLYTIDSRYKHEIHCKIIMQLYFIFKSVYGWKII
jgi:hypothetical protein